MAKPAELRLPGSERKNEDATKEADLVVIVTVKTAVVELPSALGAADYQANIAITKILKGSEDRKQIDFDLRVRNNWGNLLLS